MKARNVVWSVFVVLALSVMGCPKSIESYPEIEASFPIPAGTFVGEIKGKFYNIVLTNEYSYFPEEKTAGGWGPSYYLFFRHAVKVANGYQWLGGDGWSVSPMQVCGEATAKYPIVDLNPLAFLLPDNTNDKIMPETLNLPKDIRWPYKEEPPSYFDVPVDIRLEWRTPRRW